MFFLRELKEKKVVKLSLIIIIETKKTTGKKNSSCCWVIFCGRVSWKSAREVEMNVDWWEENLQALTIQPTNQPTNQPAQPTLTTEKKRSV